MAFVVLIPALFLGSCLCGEGVNRGDVNLISLNEEWRIGAALTEELSQEVQLVQDSEVQAYVSQMGQRLADETDLADRPWHFHVVVDLEVNAFAIPGGHVYVNTGLITTVENAAELAGVMAHEVAHGAARHATERMTQAYGVDALLRLLVGGDAGLLQQLAAELGRQGALAKFSRDDEREADRLGVRYMHAAGYDPEGMAAFFETLRAQREAHPGLVEQFFATHPLTEERLKVARQQAEELSDGADLTTRESDFQQVQERLRQLDLSPAADAAPLPQSHFRMPSMALRAVEP